jgi:hypothetical protein
MFVSPYQTTPCKDYKIEMTANEIIKERIDGNLLGDRFPVEVVGPLSTSIPVFTQPLTALEFGDRKDKPSIVIDGRAMLRHNRNGDRPYSVTNFSEMELQESRALLQLFWQNEENSKVDLLRAGDLPAIAFVNWISRTIAGKLGLDPEQQMVLAIVTGYYYSNLFYYEAEFDDNTKLKIAQSVARWTRIPVDKILEVTDELSYLANVKEFIGAVRKSVESTRVDHLELGFLYALLGGSWFGSNSRETVCVALEHPPTFLALVLASLNTKSYRNATLAKVVTMAVKGGNDRDFVRGVTFLLPKSDVGRG